MARLDDDSVDLIIAPSKRRPADDVALRRAIEADRKRPGAGKLAAEVLKMIQERRRKKKRRVPTYG